MIWSGRMRASRYSPFFCDRYRALAFAITELSHPIARDVLHWIRVERLDMLSLRFEPQEVVLELA
ncbi:hypothetical protein SRABI13_01482 [Erwinia aphidicola]|nr:hypothetical protein SRABI13_01482 [Erwinia aphidicola]